MSHPTEHVYVVTVSDGHEQTVDSVWYFRVDADSRVSELKRYTTKVIRVLVECHWEQEPPRFRLGP